MFCAFSWWDPIERIKKFLKLYNQLVSLYNNEISEDEFEGSLLSVGNKVKGSDSLYWIEWWDGQNTGISFFEEELVNLSFADIARQTLIKELKTFTNKQTFRTIASMHPTSKIPIGFTIEEAVYSRTLIGAIYQDFWNLVTRNEPISICENPNCKLPFSKVKRQKYCNDACKQEAYRLRKANITII